MEQNQNDLRVFNAPIRLANWCGLYMCQVNNHLSRASLGYKTPEEISTGNTPDISKFQFHFYKPLWYFEPKIKTPKSNLLKARFLAIADSCGDAMTYHILTEPEAPKTQQVLTRSVVWTQRENIGLTTGYVNNNASSVSFTLTPSELNHITIDSNDDVPIIKGGEKIADAFITEDPDDDVDNVDPV